MDHAGSGGGGHVLEGGRGPYTARAEPGGATSEVEWIGGGKQDPETGLYEWYERPPGWEERPQGIPGLTWTKLLEQWLLVEDDLHQVYGIDVATGILRERNWRWLRTRIVGLLSTDSRTSRHFVPPPKRGRQGGR